MRYTRVYQTALHGGGGATAHQLAHILLSLEDYPVEIWDPETEEWEGVTGFTSDVENDLIRLYSDSDDNPELCDQCDLTDCEHMQKGRTA